MSWPQRTSERAEAKEAVSVGKERSRWSSKKEEGNSGAVRPSIVDIRDKNVNAQLMPGWWLCWWLCLCSNAYLCLHTQSMCSVMKMRVSKLWVGTVNRQNRQNRKDRRETNRKQRTKKYGEIKGLHNKLQIIKSKLKKGWKMYLRKGYNNHYCHVTLSKKERQTNIDTEAEKLRGMNKSKNREVYEKQKRREEKEIENRKGWIPANEKWKIKKKEQIGKNNKKGADIHWFFKRRAGGLIKKGWVEKKKRRRETWRIAGKEGSKVIGRIPVYIGECCCYKTGRERAAWISIRGKEGSAKVGRVGRERMKQIFAWLYTEVRKRISDITPKTWKEERDENWKGRPKTRKEHIEEKTRELLVPRIIRREEGSELNIHVNKVIKDKYQRILLEAIIAWGKQETKGEDKKVGEDFEIAMGECGGYGVPEKRRRQWLKRRKREWKEEEEKMIEDKESGEPQGRIREEERKKEDWREVGHEKAEWKIGWREGLEKYKEARARKLRRRRENKKKEEKEQKNKKEGKKKGGKNGEKGGKENIGTIEGCEILPVGIRQWEEHLRPALAEGKKRLNVASFEIMVEEDEMDSEQGRMVVSFKDREESIQKAAIWEEVEKWRREGKIKLWTRIKGLGREEMEAYSRRKVYNDCTVVITGAETLEEAGKIEAYIEEYSDERCRGQVLKVEKGGLWRVYVKLGTQKEKDRLQKRWLEAKKKRKGNRELWKYMMYEDRDLQNKVVMEKKAKWFMMALNEKFEQKVGEIGKGLNKEFIDKIKEVVGGVVPDIWEEAEREGGKVAFPLEICKAAMFLWVGEEQRKIRTVERKLQSFKFKEKLSIWFQNVGGGLGKKLEKGAAIDMAHRMEDPVISCIQEHLLGEKKAGGVASFRKRYKLEGRTLVAVSAGHQHKGRGRPSGGLAMYVKDGMLQNYQAQVVVNTAYMQAVRFARIGGEGREEDEILIINVYVKPDLGTERGMVDRRRRWWGMVRKVIGEAKGLVVMVGDYNRDLSGHRKGKSKKEEGGLEEDMKEMRKGNWISLNGDLAKGRHTFSQVDREGGDVGTSIVDHAVVPKDQRERWERMQITSPLHYSEGSANRIHNGICIQSKEEVWITEEDRKERYEVNDNRTDGECVPEATEGIMLPAVREMKGALSRIGKQEVTNELWKRYLDLYHMAVMMVFQITRVRIYGLRRVVTGFRERRWNVPDDKELMDLKVKLKALKEELRQHKERRGGDGKREDKEVEQIREEQQKITREVGRRIGELGRKREEKMFRQREGITVQKMLEKYAREKREEGRKWPKRIQCAAGTFERHEGMRKFYGEEIMGEVKERDRVEHIPRTRELEPERKLVTAEGIRVVLGKIRTEWEEEARRVGWLEEEHKEGLKRGKAPGITGTPVDFFKDGREPMVELLEEWMETFEEEGYIPEFLKIDLKKPLPKFGPRASKKERSQAKNYRPIALQCACMKILDGLVKNQIEEINDNKGLIDINQGGFKRKEGSTENLFVLQEAFDSNEQIVVGFLDLSKAYDTVWREALLEKLDKTYGMPENIRRMVGAMYSQTRSIIQIEDTVGEVYQTHRGLLQGALSSPILFNLYIDELIKELKVVAREEGIGVKVVGERMNSLFFADDICLMSKDIKGMQRLLEICSKYADKWLLKFNSDKCNVVAKGMKLEARLQEQESKTFRIQGRKVKTLSQVNKKAYKYLGLPVGRIGIDVREYTDRIKKRMRAATAVGKQFCRDYNLSNKHRLSVFKATIRSVIEYGAAVAAFSDQEYRELEREQERALKEVMNVSPRSSYRTMLGVYGISRIKQRFHRLTVNFWLKVKRAKKGRSLARKVVEGMEQRRKGAQWHKQMGIRRQFHKNTARIPIQVRVKNILEEMGMKIWTNVKGGVGKKVVEKVIKEQCAAKEHKERLKWWEERREGKKKGKIRLGVLAHCGRERGIKGPLERAVESKGNMTWQEAREYIPEWHHSWECKKGEMLCRLDGSPEWWAPERCEYCGEEVRQKEIHGLMSCPHKERVRNRKNVAESIMRELEEQKGWEGEMLDREISELLNDMEMCGRIGEKEGREMIAFMLGEDRIERAAGSNEEREQMEEKTYKMLMAHMSLLKMRDEGIREPGEWIKLGGGIELAREDVRAGKVVCRYKSEEGGGKLEYRNIRGWIGELTGEETTAYSLGLGAASTRSALDTLRAREYGNKVVREARGTRIYVDGSIYQHEEAEGKRYGGYGIKIEKTAKKEEVLQWGKVRTKESQRAEMTGVSQALQYIMDMQWTDREKEYTILCDCKTVVNFVNKIWRATKGYAWQSKYIRSQRKWLRRKGIKTAIKWIPGHCEIAGNEEVDTLAKIAAASWEQTKRARERLEELQVGKFARAHQRKALERFVPEV